MAKMNLQAASKTREIHLVWILARAAWLALAVFVVFGLVKAAPIYFENARQICTLTPAECTREGLMTVERLHHFETQGISITAWANYKLFSRLFATAISLFVALIIFLRKSHDRMALFVAFFLATFNGNAGVINTLGQTSPAWGLLVRSLTALSWVSFLVFFTVFPSGHFAPRWLRWVVTLFSAFFLLGTFFPGTPVDLGTSLPWFPQIAFPTMFVIMLWSQLFRYRRISTPMERQQTKWVVYGVGMMFILFLFLSLPMIFSPAYAQSDLFFILVGGLGNYTFLLIPLSISIAILRSRLFDIDVLIRRSLIYGALTVLLGSLYFGSVVLFQELFQVVTGQYQSPLATVSSTLAIAALFSPLRRRVQDFIDRRFYRKKYDAEQTLAVFATKARNEVEMEQLSTALVGAIRETVQPVSVSLWLIPGRPSQTERDS